MSRVSRELEVSTISLLHSCPSAVSWGWSNMIKKVLVVGLILFCIGFKSQAAERDYSKAVLHHTASHDVSAKEIGSWHKEFGWDGIGYHFVIRANGDIEEGREYSKIAAHAKGRNHLTGIVLTGNDEFTGQQIHALIRLLKRLKIKQIERHHEECPGEGLNVRAIRKNLSM